MTIQNLDCPAQLQIMKCVKQYLIEKGKLYWGKNATWNRAKLLPDDTAFGCYCHEVSLQIDTLDKFAYSMRSPFNSFGNPNTPFHYKKYIEHFQSESPSWMTSQMIAHHIITVTNDIYKQNEEFIHNKPQDVRIVHQWFYKKQHQVKTVYGNIYTTNSTKKVGWTFSGLVNDEDMTITI